MQSHVGIHSGRHSDRNNTGYAKGGSNMLLGKSSANEALFELRVASYQPPGEIAILWNPKSTKLHKVRNHFHANEFTVWELHVDFNFSKEGTGRNGYP